jgi:hypothetical protein
MSVVAFADPQEIQPDQFIILVPIVIATAYEEIHADRSLVGVVPRMIEIRDPTMSHRIPKNAAPL